MMCTMGAFVMTILTLLENFYNIDIIKKLEGSSLIITAVRSSIIRDYISNIFYTGQIHDQSFEAHTESRMCTRTIFSQIQVPSEIFIR